MLHGRPTILLALFPSGFAPALAAISVMVFGEGAAVAAALSPAVARLAGPVAGLPPAEDSA